MPEGMLLPPAAAQPAKVAVSPAPDAGSVTGTSSEGGESFQQVLQSELSKPEAGEEARTAAAALDAATSAVPVPVPDRVALLGLTGPSDATANFVALKTAARPEGATSGGRREAIAILPGDRADVSLEGATTTARRSAALAAGVSMRPDPEVVDGSFGAALGALERTSGDRMGLRLTGAAEIEPLSMKAVAPAPSNADASVLAPAAQTPAKVADAARPVISIPVAAPGWGDALADQVKVMAQGRQPSAELQLNPPNLGPVEIKVSLVGDQANVSFHSAHAPVREAIQASMNRLTEAFAEAGIGLGSVFVGADARSGDRQTPEQPGRGGTRSRDAGAVGEVRSVGEVLLTGPLTSLRAVDLFA